MYYIQIFVKSLTSYKNGNCSRVETDGYCIRAGRVKRSKSEPELSSITHSCLQLHFLGPFINESIDLLCTSSVDLKLSFFSVYNKSVSFEGCNYHTMTRRTMSNALPRAFFCSRWWAALSVANTTDHQLVNYC